MAGHRETIENWVSDFCESDALRRHPAPAQAVASEVLVAFLEGACGRRGVDPGEIEETDLKPALLDGVGALAVPAAARAGVPGLCGALLEDLEARGRLADGATLGRYVRALGKAYLARASGKGQTIRSPGTPIGRNDPCPCGSGLKYKRCCLGRLGD